MRILAVFLTLTVVSLAVIGFLALSNIAAVGSYGLQSSVALGDAAVQDSTSALETLGEEVIKQKATDVGRLVEVYIRAHPAMTLADLRGSDEFRRLAVQPVGETGYTALLDMGPMEIFTSSRRKRAGTWALWRPTCPGSGRCCRPPRADARLPATTTGEKSTALSPGSTPTRCRSRLAPRMEWPTWSCGLPPASGRGDRLSEPFCRIG